MVSSEQAADGGGASLPGLEEATAEPQADAVGAGRRARRGGGGRERRVVEEEKKGGPSTCTDLLDRFAGR